MLKAVQLSKSFSDKPALTALDLSISTGEIFCLLGANGAGKTTAINLFLGFLQPTSGAAYVDDLEVAANRQAIRAKLAFVPEQVHLYPLLSGLENLAFFVRLAGRKVPHTHGLLAYLDQVGLPREAAGARVSHYSKGMRQKVGLAIALAKGAQALLLDEPLSGLDPKAANEFCVLLRQLTAAGSAVLMATHDLFRAKEVGHRIGIMKAGHLAETLSSTGLNHRQLEQIYLNHMCETPVCAGGTR